MNPIEQRLRKELAACYRLIAHFRMTDLIFTHISVRVPEPEPEHHFLINPYGLMFDEITASNLVKINLQGHTVEDTVPGQPGRLCHPQRHSRRPRRRSMCAAHPHEIRLRRRRVEVWVMAGEPDFHGVLWSGGLSRL